MHVCTYNKKQSKLVLITFRLFRRDKINVGTRGMTELSLRWSNNNVTIAHTVHRDRKIEKIVLVNDACYMHLRLSAVCRVRMVYSRQVFFATYCQTCTTDKWTSNCLKNPKTPNKNDNLKTVWHKILLHSCLQWCLKTGPDRKKLGQ